ncbi:MAG: VOC family protein [Gemmatimonadales bacterium]
MSTASTRGRFVWHELMTSDPAAAQDFYGKVVGWSTSKADMGPVDYTMWMAGETPIGGVMAVPDDAKAMGAPPTWLAYVEVPEVDNTVNDAVALGAIVLAPAQTVPDVGRFAVLQDPQGAVFAVITSAAPMADEGDPQPLEFSWHELTAAELTGAVGFYEKLFGWEKKGEFDMGPMGPYHMYGRDRFTYGGMMAKSPDMPAPYWLHYVRVDSADAAADRAKSAGGTLIMGPIDVPGGDRVAILTDPQGARFAVHSKGAPINAA